MLRFHLRKRDLRQGLAGGPVVGLPGGGKLPLLAPFTSRRMHVAVPMVPFDTAQLHFRPFVEADVAGMFALDSDPAVHYYLGGIGGQLLTDPAQSRAMIHFIQAQY